MNVLIFVMSMLMLLTLMTYGRLETIRNFAFVQSEFKTYMEKIERQYINDEAIKRYENTVATTLEQQEKQERQQNPASSTLSFSLFVNNVERNAHLPELEHHLNAARNLMRFLYGGQPFFSEMEQKRPYFLNDILHALIVQTENFTGKDKLKKVKEIATIDLKDAELNEVFTKMLQGSFDEPEEIEPEEIGVQKQRRFQPPYGYYSLLDFITIQTNKLQIRVFLASPQLLMALYGNANTVEDILENRYRLYRELSNHTVTQEEANAEFQGLFQNLRLDYVPESMLNFGVSKTNPRNYQ